MGRVEAALKYSVRTSHPRFFDKLYAGSDPVGQVAELITAVLNTNVHTYAVAPAFAMMEQEVLKSMAAQVGSIPRDTSAHTLFDVARSLTTLAVCVHVSGIRLGLTARPPMEFYARVAPSPMSPP